MLRLVFLLASGVSFLSACAGVVEDSAATAPSGSAPVVATFQLRDGELTISSTSSGVRYDVADDTGRIRSQLTLEELDAFAPELGALVRSASARRQPGLDARVDGPIRQQQPADVVWGGRSLR